METKIIKIPMQRLDAGVKRSFPVMRRVRAALALVLIMASMLLFLLPIFGRTAVEGPQSVVIADTQPPQPTATIPEDTGTLTLALENGQLELAADPLSFEIPDAGTDFKALMDYRSIKDKASRQWQLQQGAWTDEQGFRRYGDYYMIALGTYYAEECGRLFRISFEDGGVIDAVVGDIKADADTDALHQHRNGNVVEFIVDTTAISRDCLVMGDMSWAGELFRGRVASIVYLGEI